MISTSIFFVLLLVMLGGVELWLRLSIPASSGDSIFEYTLESKRYKVMKRNAEIVTWGSKLQTNNLGFRDEHSVVPPKQSDEFRIIVLGDSFTVSAGVDFQDIFTSQLEKSLQQQYPHVQVINLAVGGYNILQYALVLEEVGLALQPDLVLVAVFPYNDLNNDTYAANYRQAMGEVAAEQKEPWYKGLYI